MRNKFYLKEFQFFDGEDTVVFNIVALDDDKITVAVTKCGKAYLEANASEVLAEKINNGVCIQKDGKMLINRKTLAGFMKFACDEAKKQAEKGAQSACIDDDTVYGWVVHYFEEDSIEGTLYKEDGTEYKAPIQDGASLERSQPLPLSQEAV